MNNELFQQARAQYAAKDFAGALSLFDQCLQGPLAPGETGQIQHQRGNCLIKLKDAASAVAAYSAAAEDSAYQAVGTVNYNLGMAYVALRDFDQAIECFEVAVSDATYATKYKAYSNMGSALLRLGKNAEAGVAFREAALDEANPDPTKALLNLGVCFMALDRPADAIASYESALQFDMKPDMRNKMWASLGQAYTATGQMKKAVDAFELALADKTYFLSDVASIDYQHAIAAVSQGTDQLQPTKVDLGGFEDPADVSGLDTLAADGTAVLDPIVYEQQQPIADPVYGGYGAGYPMDPNPAAESFFNQQDHMQADWTKDFQKTKRKGSILGKIFGLIIVLIVVAFGVAAYGYTQGYGYPTQESVAAELFADPDSAVEKVFCAEIGSDKAKTLAKSVIKSGDVTVDGMSKSMNESTVYVTAKTEQGGSVKYKLTMVRDMLGWKIANVELYYASQNK
ncbi:MAG: tetratricopeptide repeat protein [Coriobacteriia bacterium]|nr:tetratricopeptide repeat protein [Coriobacteriia bacterium]